MFFCFNSFALLLQKGTYLHEYTDDWEKYDKTSLPETKDFNIHLNMENITDTDYSDEKGFFKDFDTKNLGEYHDFYFESNILFLTDVFESFGNKCLVKYETDLDRFFHSLFSTPSSLEKDQTKIISIN